MTFSASPLIAVDVGNSRVKFGLFSAASSPLSSSWPEPEKTWDFTPGKDSWDSLSNWLGEISVSAARWYVGSVHRGITSELVAWLREQSAEKITLLTCRDLPLKVQLPQPDRVGIDRLLGAVAANRLRNPHAPAVVVDLGTAITVDLISSAGDFLGGAILPGIGLSTKALHQFTDLLPLLDMPGLEEPPPPLGTATLEALRSGIYWGAVGGIKQLVELLGEQAGGQAELFLTGGAAPAVANLISPTARFVPHLVLGGIALSTSPEC